MLVRLTEVGILYEITDFSLSLVVVVFCCNFVTLTTKGTKCSSTLYVVVIFRF